MFKFRLLQLNKREDLSQLNQELVKVWTHVSESGIKEEEAKYEDLSSRERFLHGGPWNDSQTLDIHLNSFETFGTVIVAEDTKENRIVGEIEFHEFEKKLHIDWMMVSPSYQQLRIGTRLISEACNYVANNVQEIWAEPEIEAENFYAQVGFERVPPDYFQLMNTKGRTSRSKIWEGFPGIRKYLYGDAANTPVYSIHLLETSSLYSRLFKMNQTIKWGSIVTPDFECIVIRRGLEGFNNKCVIFLTSNQEIEREKFSQLYKTALEFVPNNWIAYTTLKGVQLSEWELYGKIPRLLKKI